MAIGPVGRQPQMQVWDIFGCLCRNAFHLQSQKLKLPQMFPSLGAERCSWSRLTKTS